MPIFVPPIKCQGIKTKLVPAISSLYSATSQKRWVEPFCGSCVVSLNIRPETALLSDTNEHIIRFYKDIQAGDLTCGLVRDYLSDKGSKLRKKGESIYYETREEFNTSPTSLAFLFLNRSCFNGVMRFNRKGGFNVPFCRKPERFARAYITKITNQVRDFSNTLRSLNWTFIVADFRKTLDSIGQGDFAYIDPPYSGRHVDYYNSWTERDEADLVERLKKLRCQFILSTWYQNRFRTNINVNKEWSCSPYTINYFEHFYHVGSSEQLRNSMTEALISNFPAKIDLKTIIPHDRQASLFE